MSNDRKSANRLFLPPSDFDLQGSGFEPPYVSDQRQGGNEANNRNDLESATSTNSEEDEYEYFNTEPRVMHQAPPQDLTAVFGVDYAKFFEAFGLRPKNSQAPTSFATTASVKRPAASTESVDKMKTPQSRAAVVSPIQKPSSSVPSKRAGPSTTEAAKRVRLDPLVTSNLANDGATTPKGIARVVEKGEATKIKGSGIYKKGNWAWISDEEDGKKDEKILAEAREIAAFAEASAEAPAKLTRRQLRDLKSKVGASPATTPVQARNSSTEPQSAQEHATGRRTSLRARIAPDYSESIHMEVADDEPTMSPKEKTPSTLDSPVSHGSTPAPGQATRSTSASTVPHREPKTEQLTRPKMSWNAIVYEVFANSEVPELTLAEVQEGVKERFPFFGLLENAKTLESSPRNPLYLHPGFYRVQRPDGKTVWGLKPGDFLDKKTNKVLGTVLPAGPGRTISSIEAVDASEKAVTETPLTPHLQTPPASSGEAEPVTSISNEKLSSDEAPSEKSLQMITSGRNEVNEDSVQDEKRMARAFSPQVVPETQLPRSSPQVVMETQQPVVAQPIAQQSSILSTPQSKEQRRLEGLVHRYLDETFTQQDMDWFLQSTKLWYFKNMILTQGDVACILEKMFPTRYNRSTDANMELCARELQTDYSTRVWASDWLLNFTEDNVFEFDNNNAGFISYAAGKKGWRQEFWRARTRWNHDICARILSPLSDAIDVEKIWAIKHWHDYVQKLYVTACDAMCDLRGQDHVFRVIRTELEDRYPVRDSSMWDVPRVRLAHEKPADRKSSIASSFSATRPGSAASSVHHTPIKTTASPISSWFSPRSISINLPGSQGAARTGSINREQVNSTPSATIDLS